MRLISTLLALVFATALNAQDIMSFESSKVNVNIQGAKKEATTPEPSVITVDFAAGTVNIATSNPEVKALLQDKMTMSITKELGEVGKQFSLHLDEFILAHFYTEMGMIIFTRNDVHPLKWGIQFMETSSPEASQG